MKKLFILIILCNYTINAQNKNGTVKDQNTILGIENVNIKVNKTTITTVTDKYGEFNLHFTNNLLANDTVFFSHIGYLSKEILFSNLKDSQFNIELAPETESLNETTIYSSKSLKDKISFTKLSNLKKGVYAFGAVLINDKIYIEGGDISFESDAFKKLQYEKPDFTMEDYIFELRMQFSGNAFSGNLYIYDITQNLWEKSKINFTKRAYHNLNYYKNQIYIIGGRHKSRNGIYDYLDNTIEVFDINNNNIAIDKTNPHQAANFASLNYKNTLILLGGSSKSNEKKEKTYSKEVHMYDLDSGYWYKLTDMPKAMETNGIILNDKIYLIAGFNSKDMTFIQTFDLKTEKWEEIAQLPAAMAKPALASYNDTIYLFENGKISTFDIKTKILKTYYIDLPFIDSQLFIYHDSLYILGGAIEKYYSKEPSTQISKINLDEFNKTKSKYFQL